MSDAANFVSSLPFPARIGVTADTGADDALSLASDSSLHNHVGTIHAGALFTLGECASGVAVLRDLGATFGDAMVVAKNAVISFQKPARGKISAEGALAEDATTLLRRLEADGKVTFEVAVQIKDANYTVVATMNVTWYARKSVVVNSRTVTWR